MENARSQPERYRFTALCGASWPRTPPGVPTFLNTDFPHFLLLPYDSKLATTPSWLIYPAGYHAQKERPREADGPSRGKPAGYCIQKGEAERGRRAGQAGQLASWLASWLAGCLAGWLAS